MLKYAIVLLLITASSVFAGGSAFVASLTKPTTSFTKPEPGEGNPAGAATVPRRSGPKAFSAPTPNLPATKGVDFKLGSVLFRREWQVEQGMFSGLGPNYNARSCEACHIRDGRGHPPNGQSDNVVSMFLKVGIPSKMASKDYIAILPDPNYGHQLQDFATQGPPEYQLQISYEDIPVLL